MRSFSFLALLLAFCAPSDFLYLYAFIASLLILSMRRRWRGSNFSDCLVLTSRSPSSFLATFLAVPLSLIYLAIYVCYSIGCHCALDRRKRELGPGQTWLFSSASPSAGCDALESFVNLYFFNFFFRFIHAKTDLLFGSLCLVAIITKGKFISIEMLTRRVLGN